MYGENGALLRRELATLLRQHRIQPRLGGPGSHTMPATTTVEQRQAIGEQIRRYRHAVLVWCLQAIRATNPRTNLDASSRRAIGPADQLEVLLAEAIKDSTAGLPPLRELTTKQQFEMVESWRQAARAAALGEHDFDAGLGHGLLTEPQSMTVIKDAADIARGVVALDLRYSNIPGWESLKGPRRIAQWADKCARFASSSGPDYTVDLLGWHPPLRGLIQGPGMPGLPGVLQAEHNLLIGLGTFPTARNLRLVLDSQRVLSHEASLRFREITPDLADRWDTRAETYATVIRHTRDLGGMVGNGGESAAEGANTLSRLRRVSRSQIAEPEPLHRLDRLFTRVDARISDIIEHGAAERLYLLRQKLDCLEDHLHGVVKPARERYVPITSPVQTQLLDTVRRQLRPPPTRATPTVGDDRSNEDLSLNAGTRSDLQDALSHRPEPRRTSLSM